MLFMNLRGFGLGGLLGDSVLEFLPAAWAGLLDMPGSYFYIHSFLLARSWLEIDRAGFLWLGELCLETTSWLNE